MSGFTFAVGNLAKVASLPLYGAGALVSRFVPRDDSLWVIGCGTGLAEGPLAVARAASAVPARRVVWLASDADEASAARAQGLTAYRKRSWRGFWTTMRARVLVITHGFGDVNRFATRGALTVDLHHGTPIKLLHLDSPATLRLPLLDRFGVGRRALKAMYVRSAAGMALFVAASPLAAERFATAYHLQPEQIALTGDPRMDALASHAADIEQELLAALGLSSRPAGGLILYAPTWRDGQADPVGPTSREWASIVALLESLDAVLVVRSHPLGFSAPDVMPPDSSRVRFLSSSIWTDITPALNAIDVLVTDYSAISIDFAVTGKPIIFFAPDVAAYAGSRGLYESYETFTEGAYAKSWTAVTDELRHLHVDPTFLAQRRARTTRLADRFVAYRDGRNTPRLLAAIEARLSGSD